MRGAEKLFHGLTAGDVMRRAAVVVPHRMSVVAAARLLREQQVCAAPVTDTPGRCVGVLSAADVLRWTADGGPAGEEEGALAACVWCDWQLVDVKTVQRDEVRRYMMCDPLLIRPDTRLSETAGTLLANQRPVVVVDEEDRPLGVVSSNSVLAALASAERRPDQPPAVAATNRRFSSRRLAQPLGRP
jgi:CBS domain-containing protein